MNIASTSDDTATPLLPSVEDAEALPIAGDELEKDSTETFESRCDVPSDEPSPVRGGVSALSLAMIIFYNVTGEPLMIKSFFFDTR